MKTDSARGGRFAAHAALLGVMNDHQPLSSALGPVCESLGDEREKRLARELAFGVMRWLPRLSVLLDALIDRPLKPKDHDLKIVLLLGLYQLMFTRIPAHAAVAESVSMSRALAKPWASGLINAVLRRFQRERESLEAAAMRDSSARFAHPEWLLGAIQGAWPDDWRDIVEAGNQHAPMVLRINRRRTSRDAYLQLLAASGRSARAADYTQTGIILDTPVDVADLPGFADGWVSVQDAAAQLAAPLLQLQPGMRVLDACAAPGGKTAHLLESEIELSELVALDIADERLKRVEENLARLSLNCTMMHADAADPNSWWDGQPFQRILLDAPCTATGIIRRQPDVKFHRSSADLKRLEVIQTNLLEAVWPLLARGGLLLYATCSILPRENQQRIVKFVESRNDAEARSIEAGWGRPVEPGRQILPGEHEMDGFYYALLAKS